MTDTTNDPGAMAAAYLDLWQQQLQQMAQDPAWQQMTAQNMQQFFASFSGAGPGFSAKPFAHDGQSATAPGAAPAAAASDGGAGSLAELGHRLAAVEARLADLDARVSKSGA